MGRVWAFHALRYLCITLTGSAVFKSGMSWALENSATHSREGPEAAQGSALKISCAIFTSSARKLGKLKQHQQYSINTAMSSKWEKKKTMALAASPQGTWGSSYSSHVFILIVCPWFGGGMGHAKAGFPPELVCMTPMHNSMSLLNREFSSVAVHT